MLYLCAIVRRFKISKNDHIIDVKPFDDIDFVCPYHSTTHGGNQASAGSADTTHEEHYLIYRVSGTYTI
jgi:hypothetical protein